HAAFVERGFDRRRALLDAGDRRTHMDELRHVAAPGRLGRQYRKCAVPALSACASETHTALRCIPKSSSTIAPVIIDAPVVSHQIVSATSSGWPMRLSGDTLIWCARRCANVSGARRSTKPCSTSAGHTALTR